MARVAISHPDKVLFSDISLTKAELADHYNAVADRMLVHLKLRPVAMERFPAGIDAKGFYQKDIPSYAPQWIRRVEVPKKGGTLTQLVADHRDTLMWMANQNTVTVHMWTSTIDDLTAPNRIVLDLDPSTPEVDPARRGALAVRMVLDEIGLASYPMTSGSRGYHVHSPIRPTPAAGDVALDIARLVAAREPHEFTVEHRIEDRGDRVFIDYMRNRYAQHAVAPYTVRARPQATVATPIAWDELMDTEPQGFVVRGFARRLESDDPWTGLSRRARSLTEPRKRLSRLLAEVGLQPTTS